MTQCESESRIHQDSDVRQPINTDEKSDITMLFTLTTESLAVSTIFRLISGAETVSTLKVRFLNLFA